MPLPEVRPEGPPKPKINSASKVRFVIGQFIEINPYGHKSTTLTTYSNCLPSLYGNYTDRIIRDLTPEVIQQLCKAHAEMYSRGKVTQARAAHNKLVGWLDRRWDIDVARFWEEDNTGRHAALPQVDEPPLVVLHAINTIFAVAATMGSTVTRKHLLSLSWGQFKRVREPVDAIHFPTTRVGKVIPINVDNEDIGFQAFKTLWSWSGPKAAGFVGPMIPAVVGEARIMPYRALAKFLERAADGAEVETRKAEPDDMQLFSVD